MDIISKIKKDAKKKLMKIAFPETDDERVMQAVSVLSRENICIPVLVGNIDSVKSSALENGVSLKNIVVMDNEADRDMEKFASAIFRIKGSYTDVDGAKEALLNPLLYSIMLLNSGRVDGVVAGATHESSETIRPALKILKKGFASSFFLMVGKKTFLFADCGLNIDPDARQLAQIAAQTNDSAKRFGLKPKLAFLSFSTMGKDGGLAKIHNAIRILRNNRKDIIAEGPLQVDAAIIPEIAARKYPDSILKGDANVLIFPDLNSGNIAYKLSERLGNFQAIGPILQGLKKPVNDLSRGCSKEDIIMVAAITAIQAQETK
jgi:phosphate acetyltransferase